MGVLDVTQAGSADTEVVAGILVAAAQDLIQKGQMLWHVNSVSAQAIETDVRAGRYWLAHDAGRPIGVFRYETCDPVFWPEVTDGRSAFLHKVAVHPRARGRDMAQHLLAFACKLARANGLRDVRLDCVSGRPKLRSVYERFGFRYHSPWQVGTLQVDRLVFPLVSPKG